MKDQQRKDTVSARILFEPLTTGVRCAAVDEKGKTLWGYVAGKETIRERHQLVAIYDTLTELIKERLVRYGKANAKNEMPTVEDVRQFITKAKKALEELEVSYAERNLKNEEIRKRKLQKAPALCGAVQDMLTTIEIVESASKSGKTTTDEFRLN